MENKVDIGKVEKLNQLKAQQEQLQKEIEIQAKLAQNDVKKAEAIEYAQKSLNGRLINIKKIEEIKQYYLKTYPQLEGKVSNTTITETPRTYLYKEDGTTDYDNPWIGEKIEKVIETIILSYKDHILAFQSSGKVELPYKIANSIREYTIKGAIKKIDEYVERLAYENKIKQIQNNAVQSAMDELEEMFRVDNIDASFEHKISGYFSKYEKRNWIEYDAIEIKFKNGNFIKYRVGYKYDAEQLSGYVHTLSLVEFKDNRLEEIKRSPIKLINHLK
jgi:hypothetical protein